MADPQDVNIKMDKLTAGTLDVSKTFLASGVIRTYLFAPRPASDLLDQAISDPAKSVVYTWAFDHVLIALCGLVINPEFGEAAMWCIAGDSPNSWPIVKGAAEALLKLGFRDLGLEAVRTSCERSDAIAVSALRDSGLSEEGTQHRPYAPGRPSADRLLFGVLRADWQPEYSKRPLGLLARCRWEDRYSFYSFLALQLALLAILDLLTFITDGWFSLCLALVLNPVVLYVDKRIYERIRDEQQLGARSLSFGALFSGVFALTAILSAVYRVRWAAGFGVSWLAVVIITLILAAFEFIAVSRAWRGRVPWLWIGSLMIGLPIFCVWLPLSDLASQWTGFNRPGFTQWKDDAAERGRVIAERRSRQTGPARVPRVALALSGGGYRAALIHAGVLSGLDRAHIPLRYLSTVSGGSIIGAHYALGYAPSEFIRATYRQKPGLGFEKLSLFSLIPAWLLPRGSSADVYADHFARFYFGSATLNDLPDTPVLIVNATDIEASAQNSREIFTREVAGLAQGLASSTRIADVVAASGAFPGAFEPKSIRWFNANTDLRQAKIVPRRFIDGGVLENVGLEGLRRYFRIRRSLGLDLNKPDLLIVSDASLSSETAPLAAKPELTDLLSRVQDISYSAFQRSLLSQFTGRADYPGWMLATAFSSQIAEVPYASIDDSLAAGEPAVLKVLIIPSTSPQMGAKLAQIPAGQCSFRGRSIAAVQHEVAAFATLKELSPPDVEKAAWLGSSLVGLYSSAIQCALDRSRNPSAACMPPSAPICPAIEEIAPRLNQD